MACILGTSGDAQALREVSERNMGGHLRARATERLRHHRRATGAKPFTPRQWGTAICPMATWPRG